MSEPRDTIVDRFEQIARQCPGNLAVKMAARSLTYQELNNAADLVAQAILENRGAGQEPIALLFGHGIDSVTALLGVGKAGKFYFALDNAGPMERNRYILGDTQTRLLLTDDANLRLAHELSQGLIPILNVDDVGSEINSKETRHPATLDELFAINYTSGSTGLPKAVMQTHSSRLYDTELHADMANIVPTDRLSLLHPAGFVGAEVQLFRGLYSGAALLPFDLRSYGTQALLQWLRREVITVLHITPASFREFAALITDREMLPQLRLVNLSGAPIREQDVSLFKDRFSPLTRLIIHMGSTEAGAICSAAIVGNFSFPRQGTPVGYSFPGKAVVVLDEAHNDVAPGAVGEIAVRSRYLAAGYWHDPELTRKKFLPDPAGSDLRTYLTGDLGRQLPDGFLLHLGRKDLMVKVRGNRVELGEIESALLAHGQIKDAAVSAWEEKEGDKILAAYIVAKDQSAPSVNELRTFLAAKLPDFMIPARFIYLPSLPLKNGKLDRQALPEPDDKRPTLSAPYASPRNEMEKSLVQLWEEVLDVRPIGIRDKFFDLGGHSLLAVRLFAKIETTFGKQLRPATLFEAPTIEQLATILKGPVRAAPWSALVPIQPNGSKPPLFWVHGDSSNAFLPNYLDSDQPIFGLEHQSQDGKPARYKTVETTAGHYLQEIQMVQPKGPYFLGGYSFGGTVAFEIAQQLTLHKEDVGLLVILDSGFPGLGAYLAQREAYSAESRTEGETPSAILRRHWRNLSQLGVKAKTQYVTRRFLGRLKERNQGIGKLLRKTIWRVNIALGLPIPRFLRSDYILNIYDDHARGSYAPMRYEGKVFYVKSEQRPRDHIDKWREVIVGELEIYKVPGGHADIPHEPFVSLWAGAVQARLAESQLTAVRKVTRE